jgi:hypothetical protein
MSMQERLYLLGILMPFGEQDVYDAVCAKCREVQVGNDMEVCGGAGAEVVPFGKSHDEGLDI